MANNNLPGTPPEEDDALDLVQRLTYIISQYPSDAQGRKALRELHSVFERKLKGEEAIPEWAPVCNWPNTGEGWAPTSWIISDMLPADKVSLFSGAGSAGKTRIIMQLAAGFCLGLQEPFLMKDHITNPPCFTAAFGRDGEPKPGWRGGNVVWASWETSPGDFQQRLADAVTEIPLEELSGVFHYLNMRPHGALWGPEKSQHISTAATVLEGGRKLLDYAELTGAKLLVLDPLAAAYASNENDRSLVRAFNTYLAEWAYQHECTVIIIGHPSKAKDDTFGYSGNTDWHNGVQSRWELSQCNCKEKDATPCRVRRLIVRKVNEAKESDDAIPFEWDEGQHTFALVNHNPAQQTKKTGRGKSVGQRPPKDADSPEAAHLRPCQSQPGTADEEDREGQERRPTPPEGC